MPNMSTKLIKLKLKGGPNWNASKGIIKQFN
jgi:hypothetical protein